MSKMNSGQLEAELPRREAVPQAVIFAAHLLLKSSSWEMNINQVLERLGQAMQGSRSYLFQNHGGAQPERLFFSRRYQWAAPGLASQSHHQTLTKLSYQEDGFGSWQEQFSRGETIQGYPRDFPPRVRQRLEAQSIRSLVAVPVFVEQKWWGGVGIDDCVNERAWPAAEVEALKDAASMIGAAIQNQQAEKDHQRLFILSLDLLCIVGFDTYLKQLNPAFERALGFSREDLQARSFLDLVHPEDRETARIAVENVATRGVPVSFEVRMLTKDGSFRWLLWSATPFNSEGVIYAIGKDITVRKSAEDSLRDSMEQLRHSQKMEAVGRLAGGVAHDFNNLLAVITVCSDLCLKNLAANNPLHHKISEIQHAAQRASRLTRQLLAYSRRQMLQPEVLNLNAMIEGVYKKVQQLIGEDLELSTQLDPSVGQIKADPGQLEQVIMNLAVNARDAMPRGGKLIVKTSKITVPETYTINRALVPAGVYASLIVSDTGIGMSADTQAHIFEPFFTTKAVGKGTGLGLSTVYGIIKQSNGFIWAHSELGKGTTFEIYLPQAQETSEEAPQPAPNSTISSHTAETILIAEDEEMVREAAREVLEHHGYHTLVAENSAEALAICSLHEGPIHLLLTDVVMAGMNGRELADLTEGTRPEMKVLYMSGYTNDVLDNHEVLDSEVEFMQKPFTSEDLTRKVREVLDARSV